MNLVFFSEIDLKTAAIGVFRNIIYTLDSIVYKLIIQLYDVFRWICGAKIVENDVFNELSVRVGFILGLIMFFYISFDFIQIILDPDKLSDKDKGPLNIIKKFIIVIVLLGTSRYIFDLLFNFQNIILANDDGSGSIIEKLILPYEINSDSFGRAISANFMAQFYQITDDVQEGDTLKNLDDYDYEICYDYAAALPSAIASTSSFDLGEECLNARYKHDGEDKSPVKFYIDFNYLSLPVGIFVAWMLIVYCVSVGIRVIQIALLQVISPAAIICYLSPNKENTFTKWLKLYISTYIDVFIRIAIIDFVVLLSGLIMDNVNSNDFWASSPGTPPTGWTRFWIMAFMIMALLSFAKKAPDLIKQLLPSNLTSGIGFGLGLKDNFGLGVGLGAAGAAIGTVVGGGANAVVGAIDRGQMAATLGKKPHQIFGAVMSGFGGGLFRGARYGLQNKGNFMKNIPAGFKAQHESDVKYEQLIASGGSARGALRSSITSHIGETRGQTYNRMIADLDKMDQFKKDMYAAADEISFVKSAKDTWEQMHQNEGESDYEYEARKNAAYERYKYLRNTVSDVAVDFEKRTQRDSAGNLVFTDENGDVLMNENGDAYILDEDAVRYTTDIRSTVSAASAYSTSHSVKRWNQATNSYENIGVISSRSALADASNYAHETKTHIVSEPDYSAAIANDQAAGVSDKRKYGGK